MRISSIELTNIRSVGNPGIKLTANPNLNTIIGANNVGKSSIFIAINLLASGQNFSDDDLHWGSPGETPHLKINVALDQEDADVVLRRVTGALIDRYPVAATKFKQWIASSEVSLTSTEPGCSIGGNVIRRQDLYLRESSGSTTSAAALFERLETRRNRKGIREHPSDSI